jgi:hypothetical protein
MNKFILFLTLIFTPAILSASAASDSISNMTFWVETPEILDSYFNIFNGMAALFAADSYESLLRLTFLVGGFFVFAGGVLSNMGGNASATLSGYLKYIVTGVVLITLVFSSTVTMNLQSKTVPTFCQNSSSNTAGYQVAGIPFPLALAFVTINKIGQGSTELAESTFSTPNQSIGDITMTHSGGYIGALKQSLAVMNADISKLSAQKVVTNPDGSTSPALPVPDGSPRDAGMVTKALLAECILTPFSSKGWEGLNEIEKIKNSKNIQNYLKDLYTNNPSIGGIPVRDYIAEVGGEQYKCGELADLLMPALASANSKVACGIPVGAGALQIITGAASPTLSTLNEVAIQSGLIAELGETAGSLGVGISGVSYASGKTRAEYVQTNMANGEYMAQVLPYLQMTLRALLYAFFPFLFVVVLLPGGFMALKQYAEALIWIELWSPTAAILNMFIAQIAEYRIAGTYGSSGLTSSNAVDMLSSASSIAGTAGYLYLSVPALTWLILKGSAYMLAGVAGAAAAGMSKNISTDSINQDTKNIEHGQEVNAGSEKTIGMADAQQMQAIRDGSVSGRTLAAEKTAGFDKVGDAAAMNVAQTVQASETAQEITGSGPEATGHGAGTISGINTGGQALSGDDFSGPDGNVSNTAKKAAKFDAQKSSGELDSKAYNQKFMKRGDQKLKGDYQINSDKTKATAQKTLGRDYVDSQAKTDIQKHAQNKEYQKQNGNTAQGAIKRGKGLGNRDHYKDSAGIKEVDDLQGAGIGPDQVGGADATNTAGKVGKAKATKKIADHYNPDNSNTLQSVKDLSQEIALAQGAATNEDVGGPDSDATALTQRSFKMGKDGKLENVNTALNINGLKADGNNYTNEQIIQVGYNVLHGRNATEAEAEELMTNFATFASAGKKLTTAQKNAAQVFKAGKAAIKKTSNAKKKLNKGVDETAENIIQFAKEAKKTP